jgi:hypothetical protein
MCENALSNYQWSSDGPEIYLISIFCGDDVHHFLAHRNSKLQRLSR